MSEKDIIALIEEKNRVVRENWRLREVLRRLAANVWGGEPGDPEPYPSWAAALAAVTEALGDG